MPEPVLGHYDLLGYPFCLRCGPTLHNNPIHAGEEERPCAKCKESLDSTTPPPGPRATLLAKAVQAVLVDGSAGSDLARMMAVDALCISVLLEARE